MKKGLIIGLGVLLVVGVAAFAQTTYDADWDANFGGYHGLFQSGDDFTSELWTEGSHIFGEFHAKDHDDNPYGYGVDTNFAWTKAEVENGGYVEFLCNRNDTKTSYGDAGQESWSYVMSSDGTAGMSWKSWMNYAEMGNCQYGNRANWLPGNKMFEAEGSYYEIEHTLEASNGDGAYVGAWGSGSAAIKLQGEKSRGTSFNMGRLPVCGDNCNWNNDYATYTGTGVNSFEIRAESERGLRIGADCGNTYAIPGTTTDPATYLFAVDYSGTWSWSDFGMASQ